MGIMKAYADRGTENKVDEWLLAKLDKTFEPYGTKKMMELTKFDGYDMLDAIEYGYKLAVEKACELLETNKDHPFIGCEDPCLSGYLTEDFIGWFRKAMEEEE